MGLAMVKLVPCGCGPAHLVRIERSWWMRSVVGRRLYFCTQCRSRLLIPKPALTLPAGAAWPVPPAPAAYGTQSPSTSMATEGRHGD